jgi:thiamine-phosphate pyrophosphorylase
VSARGRIGRLHVITDLTVQSRFSHEELAELACAGGADVIQLRDKRLDDESFLPIARRVREICTRYGATFIVNDRVGIARAAGADGVHVGRADASIPHARAALESGAIVGTSAGSLDDARLAERAGPDYVGFGHIFPTTSKVKGTAPVGLDALAGVCARISTPIIAIGGITAANAGEVMRAGAWGVAVIAAVCAAPDPRAATATLREIVGKY